MNPVSRTLRTLAVLTAATALVLPGSGAQAAEKQQPAVFGPTIGFFDFGADVGLPIGCTLVLGYVRDGADLFGQADNADPVISGAAGGCDQLGTQAKVLLKQGRTQAQPAVALNPFLNPAIGQAAASMRIIGKDYATLVAPFGPTIAGSGDTIDFFQGR